MAQSSALQTGLTTILAYILHSTTSPSHHIHHPHLPPTPSSDVIKSL